MKRILCTICAVLMLFSLVACTAQEESEAVLPPVREGGGESKVSFEKGYTFESALEEADAVARIRVGNWIAEDNEARQTYYEAEVLECYKGEIPTNFTLLQDGCSLRTFKGYPLFISGNEMLLFLREAVGLPQYDAPYWIIGAYTTLLDVVYDDGERYFVDRYGVLGQSINVVSNYANVASVADAVYTAAVESDPLMSNPVHSFPYIYSDDDMLKLLDGD